MKKLLTLKSGAWALFVLAGLALFSACEKIPGHTISTTGSTSTTTTKSANLTFIMDDTTHILSTVSLDTVGFSGTATAATSITAKNGGKNLAALLTFNVSATGTYAITGASFTEPLLSGGTLTTSTNGGTITINSINVTGGLLTGSYSCQVKDANNATVTLTGTFNIQQ